MKAEPPSISHEQIVAMNEALMIGSVRQHELNEQLRVEIAVRTRAEEALRESEKRYRSLFNSIDEGFCIIEKVEGAAGSPLDFRYLEANPAFAAQSGMSGMVGKTIRQVLPGINEEWFLTYDTVLRTGEPIRFDRELFTDGRILELYACRVEDDTHRRVAVIFKNISERKRHEQQLSEKARLLDLSNDAIIVRDLEDRISLWNKGAEKLYGWTSAEAMGKHLNSLLQTEFPRPMEEIVAELHRNGQFSGELLQIARDGRRVPSLCRWVLDQGTQSILTSYTDITERKTMEDALRQAHELLADRAGQLEKAVTERTAELIATNKQLEAFVYSIAHDLRAPLRSMQGFSSLLVEEAGTALSATGRDYADRIAKSAQFMDALLVDLLAFSAIAQQRVELTTVNLESAVQSVLSRLDSEIQRKNARVEIVGTWPDVMGHDQTVGQVLINLVTNALKFVDPNVLPLVRLRGEEQGEFLRVWVEDNGIGIAPDHQDQIFRLFTRLHGGRYEGTGIGLAIVEKGIERMCGRVGVESTPGQGSRFWFELWKA